MDVKITPGPLRGAITPPPSKSQAHRLIIAAALAAGESHISNVALSQDIAATLNCMRALGAWASGDGSVIRGMGGAGRSPAEGEAPDRGSAGRRPNRPPVGGGFGGRSPPARRRRAACGPDPPSAGAGRGFPAETGDRPSAINLHQNLKKPGGNMVRTGFTSHRQVL